MVVFAWIAAISLVLLVVSAFVGDLLDGVLDSIDFTGGYLSSASLLAFTGTIGFAGWVSMYAGLSVFVAAGIGLGCGLVVGTGAGLLTRALVRSPTGHQITSADYVGAVATVVTAIPDEGYGEVTMTVSGHPLKLAARSRVSVDVGEQVVVTAVLNEATVMVAVTVAP
ncbi:hypothetical protein [Pengzhenrongella frigida]|uniref:NfeD-like C-terminal domain-containing protein n=1 Tax=Pengzhenrongella frigida TaxID=1259133 RepID=A0A4Q5N626_9MICO|nr:hypothetical protein [Cellulomonas sp. HLT2-17]RYV51621.1 hypothetical protein EUA98_07795 [Cellulomonas sp. HLT2-17]